MGAGKQKNKGIAKKRLRVTGSGKLKRKRTNLRHILTKKSSKRKRRLGQTTLVSKDDEKRLKKMLHM